MQRFLVAFIHLPIKLLDLSIYLMTVRRFIAHSLSFSPFHHLDMTLSLLKGTHNPDPSSISIYLLVKWDDQIRFPGICGQRMARLAREAVRNARYDAVKEANTQPADTEAAYLPNEQFEPVTGVCCPPMFIPKEQFYIP